MQRQARRSSSTVKSGARCRATPFVPRYPTTWKTGWPSSASSSPRPSRAPRAGLVSPGLPRSRPRCGGSRRWWRVGRGRGGVRGGRERGRTAALSRRGERDPLRGRCHRHAHGQRREPDSRRQPMAAGGDDPRADRLEDGPSGPGRQLCRGHWGARRGPPRAGRPLVGRDADHRRRPRVGSDGHLLQPGATPTTGYRGAARVVHGAGGDGDREHRGANGGGAARR